ncbi:GTP-binding protein At2g22870 [Phalaenopsis equestris]|uniref:GTP-binding protein At2g22870 n=1 Tax=Phalaenopsis equestris TaxID=78828 RepID=UPI0009E393FB|nr:GTP-binding protein At2g22870 [Phalaenopsis equestris]
MALHYQQRILTRFLSISFRSPSFRFHRSSPSRFFSISSSSAADAAVATEFHLPALPKQLQLDTPLSPLIPDRSLNDIPLDKLFVPPEVELPAAANSVARGRILKCSNIVLGSYSLDPQVSTAEFVKSSTCTEDCPADSLPDFALVGRSNVGKSSLLNSLVRRKRLALISKKPGKTQCINHFLINDSWYLVDLPGYGYASAPQKLRTDWDGFTKDYFLKRETLVSVFLLIDASIPPKKIDLEYASWLSQNQIPMTLIFTKCDKRKKKKNGGKMAEENAGAFLSLIAEYFEAAPAWIMASSVTNMGRDEILLHIAQLRNYWLKH